ncbi:RDD family protein [Gimesia sp.]|uniref:RDD family protein n=1 Tax=Gimesia sp. TaxID=2024833 RepID=UPI003A8C8974
MASTITLDETTPIAADFPESFIPGKREILGLEMQVETPENVVLSYQLAGPSQRYVAYLIDFLIRMMMLLAIFMFFIAPMSSVMMPGAMIGLFLIISFLNTWGYYTISETFFKGKSIGKHICGLRVIREGGYPITFWPSLLRNLARSADSIILYGVGITSMLLTRRFQRLGDLLAGTVVIQERTLALPRKPIILNKIKPLDKNEIGSFLPRDEVLSLIDEFIGRRHVLTYERGHALAAQLAQQLAKRLHYTGDEKKVSQYPMAFLASVYKTFSFSQDQEEQELLAEYKKRSDLQGEHYE